MLIISLLAEYTDLRYSDIRLPVASNFDSIAGGSTDAAAAAAETASSRTLP
jgi:hypothetical protein